MAWAQLQCGAMGVSDSGSDSQLDLQLVAMVMTARLSGRGLASARCSAGAMRRTVVILRRLRLEGRTLGLMMMRMRMMIIAAAEAALQSRCYLRQQHHERLFLRVQLPQGPLQEQHRPVRLHQVQAVARPLWRPKWHAAPSVWTTCQQGEVCPAPQWMPRASRLPAKGVQAVLQPQLNLLLGQTQAAAPLRQALLQRAASAPARP